MKKAVSLLLALAIAITSIASTYQAVCAEVTVSSVVDGTLYAIGGAFYMVKEAFRTSLNILGSIPSVERVSEYTSKLADEACSYAETISRKINGQDTELINISSDGSPIQYNSGNNSFSYNPTYINNYNQVVQDSVTKLNGYYLLDNYIDSNEVRRIVDGLGSSAEDTDAFLDRLSQYPYTYIMLPGSFNAKTTNGGNYCLFYGLGQEFCGIIGASGNDYIDFYIYSLGSYLSDSRVSVHTNRSITKYYYDSSNGIYTYYSTCTIPEIFGYFRCYSGSPFKVFYSEDDFSYYMKNGKRHYAPRLPANISVPATEINNYPTYISNEYNNVVNNMDSGLTETDIQNMIDIAIENYINTHQPPAVTDTPNPTATPGQGTSTDYTNILDNIYTTLKSLVSGHTSFEAKIFAYFETNNRKLDELITAVNKLDTGQTSGETDGCQYDFTELSGFLTSIWEESAGKYDHMADLLSQNNQYQQQLIHALDGMTFPPSYDYTDTLKSLDNALKSLVSGHTSFEARIFTYFEDNNKKLDELITAVDKLSPGHPSGTDNGCQYDYTELNGFLTSLWEESLGRYDSMIALLEENNQYQQQLIDTLDSIKNILLFDTAMELLKDRASQTAETAKGKFPTSLPWDVALVVNAMCAAPETPVIKCPVEIQSLGIQEEFVIDLSGDEWGKLAKTCRSLLSLLFVLYMIHLTRQLITGGDGK